MEGRKEGMRTLPDGFNGAVMAVESISDAMAFLHGPGGCRVRQMVHSTAVFPREDPDDVRGYFIPYFNGYPRVPATYLDEYDYINGAFYKVVEGLDVVNSKNPELVVIVNSPGAALIGDNHEKAIRDMGLQSKVMYMDESLVSMPMTSCYGHMLRAVLEFLEPSRDHPMEGTFILLGMTVLDKDWRAATEELSGLLESMGLKFICAPGAGASTTDLVESVNAEFAVVVSPESCEGLTEFYSEHGVKVIRSPGGAPVGFDAVETWLRNGSIIRPRSLIQGEGQGLREVRRYEVQCSAHQGHDVLCRRGGIHRASSDRMAVQLSGHGTCCCEGRSRCGSTGGGGIGRIPAIHRLQRFDGFGTEGRLWRRVL